MQTREEVHVSDCCVYKHAVLILFFLPFLTFLCYADVLLVCLPVACNICLIFVKRYSSTHRLYIMDQSHLHFV